jgi:hypothetical protein
MTDTRAEHDRSAITIAGAQRSDDPFAHALVPECIDAKTLFACNDWFSDNAPWKLAKTDFYEQYEFDLCDAKHWLVQRLSGATTTSQIVGEMEQLFKTRFAAEFSVTAHKLIKGQQIGIHNDWIAGQETHRLVIHLGHWATAVDGGLLTVLAGPAVADTVRLIKPIPRSGFAFQISPTSYHAVSTVHNDDRYSLVYSFRAA